MSNISCSCVREREAARDMVCESDDLDLCKTLNRFVCHTQLKLHGIRRGSDERELFPGKPSDYVPSTMLCLSRRGRCMADELNTTLLLSLCELVHARVARTRARSLCVSAACARPRATRNRASPAPARCLAAAAQLGPLRRPPQYDDVGSVHGGPPQVLSRGAEPRASAGPWCSSRSTNNKRGSSPRMPSPVEATAWRALRSWPLVRSCVEQRTTQPARRTQRALPDESRT